MRTFPVIKSRPYVIYSVASSIDGKTATKSGDSMLSDIHDWREVHKLRSSVGAIVVGVNTILEDDARLVIADEIEMNLTSYPYRVVVDSLLRTPPSARVVQLKKEKYQTIIATLKPPPQKISSRKQQLENEGAKIIEAGQDTQVDIGTLLSELKSMGIDSVMLEGGGTLAWSFLKSGFIDEIRHFISPLLCGGTQSISMIMGEGFNTMTDSPKFKLRNVVHRDDYLTLEYQNKSNTHLYNLK